MYKNNMLFQSLKIKTIVIKNRNNKEMTNKS